MPTGPGKYDRLLTVAREAAVASCAILIIGDGILGSGFSMQATPEYYEKIPKILRTIADEVEVENRRQKESGS